MQRHTRPMSPITLIIFLVIFLAGADVSAATDGTHIETKSRINRNQAARAA